MKASDIARIPDPHARFVQSMQFLHSLKETEETVAKIRDLALLDLRDKESDRKRTLRQLAEVVGISTQRVSQLEQTARERYGSQPVRESRMGRTEERSEIQAPSSG